MDQDYESKSHSFLILFHNANANKPAHNSWAENLSNLPLTHQTTHLHTYQREVTNELRATALCGL